MSWIDSILYFVALSGEPPEILLNRTSPVTYSGWYFKGKSDYVTEPISETGLESIWRRVLESPEAVNMILSPYGGRLSEISESATPFPHRAGPYTAFITESSGPKQGKAHWTGKRAIRREPTSYEQASIWGLKYYGINFKRLVHVKTKVDPGNFFRNEQSIPTL
ncbi:hypothetical protein C3L33_06336, partial [Rhododendron williamsianum]